MKRPLFILAGNGPYLNRGSEAIVRGTAEILRKHFPDPRFLVCSDFTTKTAWFAQRRQELDHGSLPLYTDLDDLVTRRGKKRILWGASAGPFDGRPEDEVFMAAHLKKQTAIFSRESCARAYLEKIGVTRNVYDVAAPAFVLQLLEPRDAARFGRLDETIGIHLSPGLGLIRSREVPGFLKSFLKYPPGTPITGRSRPEWRPEGLS